jgi:hypothetical protein
MENKTIDIVIVDFEKPEKGLPSLALDCEDATCKTTTKFYNSLKEKGLTDAKVDVYTVLQGDRSIANDFVLIRNLCKDSPDARVDRGESRYGRIERESDLVIQRLEEQKPKNGVYLLIIESEQYNIETECLLINLGHRGYKLNYRVGQQIELP